MPDSPAPTITTSVSTSASRRAIATSGFRDVDEPADAEAVGEAAELVAPHLLLERYVDRAALGQRAEPGPQAVTVVAAEADRDVVAAPGRHAWRCVRRHQDQAVGRLE